MPALSFNRVSKVFPGTKALDQVSFDVNWGEVVALMGENGAGKSTLMKILSGVWGHGSYEGEFRVLEELSKFADTRGARDAGIAMIHQELSVFPDLSVGEHLELDRLSKWIRWDELHTRVQGFLNQIGFPLRSRDIVGDLSIGSRQLVEIARALYQKARILIFDEPTSALTDQEVKSLFRVIRELRIKGCAIIYITHRMDEVFELSDRIIVLRDGRNAGEFEIDGQSRETLEPQLIKAMVGRAIDDIYPARNATFGDEILKVENLTLIPRGKKARVSELSFSLRRGEVVGFAGLLGAGRSETFEALFGVFNQDGPRARDFSVQGDVWVGSKKIRIDRPSAAIGVKMAYVTEDRKATGLVLGQSIGKNMVLPALVSDRQGLTRGKRITSWISEARETECSEHWSRELRVRAASLSQPVSELSGGNQQKVVLAKWLLTEPDILFLDEPTRGIDIGAKVEIYQWIQKLAARGMAIVVASSEMPELLGVCHRIIVLREGRKSAEFDGKTVRQEDIMRAASL